MLLAHGNHTPFIAEVETYGERIVADFVVPEDNSGYISMETTGNVATTEFFSPVDKRSPMVAEYSGTMPVHNCVCDGAKKGCLSGMCHFADKSSDLCMYFILVALATLKSKLFCVSTSQSFRMQCS